MKPFRVVMIVVALLGLSLWGRHINEENHAALRQCAQAISHSLSCSSIH